MTSIRIRPRFRKTVSLNVKEIEGLLNEKLKNHEKFNSSIDSGHITIRIKQEHRHFWSPQLSLTLEENENSTLLRGLYGPSPNVWTIFLLSYLAVGVFSLLTIFLGLSYWFLDKSLEILWILPILGLAALGLYVIAQFGQKLASEQTYRLHLFIEDCFKEEMVIS